MAVPRNRHSTARRNSKRAHDSKKPRQTVACPQCDARRLPHHACTSCGFYRGRLAVAGNKQES